MIVFNGIPIESVAPVMVEDIKVSPIQLSPVVRPRAIRFGSEFVRMGGGTRNVVITFAILEKNMAARHEALLQLSKWAKTDAEYALEFQFDPVRCLYGVCTGKPEPSTRAWWENKLRLTFTCYDNPYWTARKEKSVACGTEFFALGDAPPLMQVRHMFGQQASNQSYSDGVNTMTLSVVPAGRLIIDANKQTIISGQASIMAYYQPAGSFIVPRVGGQTITGTGTVYYRERWE